MIRVIIALIIILMISCEGRMEEDYEYFVIPSGKHAAFVPKVQSLQSKYLRFEAIFDASARYNTQTAVNQYDINKLMGFSDCNSHHHSNSARFGWRWLNDTLEIHAYVYADGERKSKLIGAVDLNESYQYELSIQDEFYVFELEGYDPVYMDRINICNKGLYYMLYPYFGGNEKAPHEIVIQIKQESF